MRETPDVLLTISTDTHPARELGVLVRKHPDRVQTFELGSGSVRVCYPEAGDERCTMALLLDIDPVSLIRGRPKNNDSVGLVEGYVNDRPYAASSFLSVAIARILGTALSGKPPEVVDATKPRLRHRHRTRTHRRARPCGKAL